MTPKQLLAVNVGFQAQKKSVLPHSTGSRPPEPHSGALPGCATPRRPTHAIVAADATSVNRCAGCFGAVSQRHERSSKQLL